MAMMSIVVPVYNASAYLEETLLALINQTCTNYEVIMVDDGSTDSSCDICKEFSSKYNNFVFVRNKKKGVSSARNCGIQLAKGDIISFVDSDDLVTEDMVEYLMTAIHDYDFAFGSYERFDSNENVVFFNSKPYCGLIVPFFDQIADYFDSLSLQSPWCKAFKKDIILKNNIVFPEDMSFGEDAYFVYEYLKYTKSVCAFDKVIYKYRITDSGLCHGFKSYKYDTNLMLNSKIYDLYIQYTQKTNETWLKKLNQKSFVSFMNDCVCADKAHDGFCAMRQAAEEELTLWSFDKTEYYVPFGNLVHIIIKRKFYLLLFIIFKINTIRHSITSKKKVKL